MIKSKQLLAIAALAAGALPSVALWFPALGQPLYVDATESNLPVKYLLGLSMDAAPVDVDGDGDLDLMIANEHRPNILLINDGRGGFANESAWRIPQVRHDSEDVGVADFDGDGDLDVIVVSEDDRLNELYFNDGRGVFSDQGARLPVTGVSNAVAVADIDADGDPDILIGNNGPNVVLINDGRGNFADRTQQRLPPIADITQDLDLGDCDGDGDLDLLVGNEDHNRILLNDGAGHFARLPEGRLPLRRTVEETREAEFGDIDGDGDLDVVFANVHFFRKGALVENRLLINDGRCAFTDETRQRLPRQKNHSVDVDFVDLDGDGDLDMVLAETGPLPLNVPKPVRVLLNDGSGRFRDGTGSVLPPTVMAIGFDVAAADFSGDGRIDLYIASRGRPDRLVLRRR